MLPKVAPSRFTLDAGSLGVLEAGIEGKPRRRQLWAHICHTKMQKQKKNMKNVGAVEVYHRWPVSRLNLDGFCELFEELQIYV